MPEPPKQKLALLNGIDMYDKSPEEDFNLSPIGYMVHELEMHSMDNKARLMTRISKIILN